MSEKADLAKRAYEELRHEYEAYQSQANGETSILTERRDELQQEADSLRQTMDSLNQEIAALRENAGVLSETNEQLKSIRVELEDAKSKLSQEQEERSSLEREVGNLRAACAENNQVKEHLRSEISDYESQVQNVNAELSTLREQHTQERDVFSEQLQQEKELLKNTLERLGQEYSDYREQTGRETVELKTDYERVRQEYEARQLQTIGEISDLKRQLEEASDAHQELKELRDQIDSEIPSKEHLQLEVNNLQNNKEELARELSGLRTQFKQIDAANQAQIDKHEKQKQFLQEQLEILQEKEKAKFQNQLEALTKRTEQDKHALKQFSEMKTLLQETQDKAGCLQKENVALQSQLSQLKSQQQRPTEPTAVPTNRDAAQVELPFGPVEAEAHPQIPRYNLAEQILSDHRRSIASQRKRVESITSKEKGDSVKNIVKQYVGESVRPEEIKADRTALCHNLWDDNSLTLFQQELLQEIIQRDILEYCKN